MWFSTQHHITGVQVKLRSKVSSISTSLMHLPWQKWNRPLNLLPAIWNCMLGLRGLKFIDFLTRNEPNSSLWVWSLDRDDSNGDPCQPFLSHWGVLSQEWQPMKSLSKVSQAWSVCYPPMCLSSAVQFKWTQYLLGNLCLAGSEVELLNVLGHLVASLTRLEREWDIGAKDLHSRMHIWSHIYVEITCKS